MNNENNTNNNLNSGNSINSQPVQSNLNNNFNEMNPVNSQPVQPNLNNNFNEMNPVNSQPVQSNLNNNFNEMNTINSQPNQFNMNQGIVPPQPMNYNNSNNSINPNTKNKASNKKNLLLIIIICSVAIVAIIIITLSLNGKKDGNSISKSNYKKTLTCGFSVALLGVPKENVQIYYINDGEFAMTSIDRYYLDKVEIEGGTPDQWAEQEIKKAKEEAKNSNEFKFSYNYKKGKLLELMATFKEEYILDTMGEELKKKNAEEIYDILKEKMEEKAYHCE